LWDCNGSESQNWTFQGGSLVSAGGLCLDVTGGSSDDGTPLQVWGCWGGANQQWGMAPGATAPSPSPSPNPNPNCNPTSCSAQGFNCGSTDDGCGNTLDCGSCSGSDTCSNNVCTHPSSGGGWSSPPPQAVAAGFTNLAWIDDFTTTNT